MRVGWAYDARERASRLLEPPAPRLIDERWVVVREQPWRTRAAAHKMEQVLLDLLDKRKLERAGECFRILRKTLVTTTWGFEAMLRAQPIEDEALRTLARSQSFARST